MDDSTRLDALEGRVEGLTLALSTLFHGMLASTPDAREALGDLLHNFAEQIRADPPWENEVVATSALGAIDHLASLFASALPKNFS